MSLPRQYRLKHRRHFSQVRQQGQCYRSPGLTCYVYLDPAAVTAQEPAKFGVSVSTKVDKRAVVRNRLRRQIQAGLRSLSSLLAPGWRVVISVRSPLVECNYVQILQQLRQLLSQAEVTYGNTGRGLLRR